MPAPITMRLSQGLNLHRDGTVTSAPNLAVAQNVWFDKDTSMRKRNGYQALPRTVLNGTALSKATSLLSYNNELLVFDDTYLYSWSQAAQQWMRRDVAIPTIVKQTPAPFASTASASTVQYTCAAGVDYYAFDDGSNVYVATADATTKALISAPQRIFTRGAGGGAPIFTSYQLCAFRASAALVLKFTSGGPTYNLGVQTISPTGAISTQVILTSNMGSASYGSYGVGFDGTSLVIAWQDTALANKPISVMPLNEALTLPPAYTLNVINCGTTSLVSVAVACSVNAKGKAWVYADSYAFQYADLTQVSSLTYPTSGVSLGGMLPYKTLGCMADDGSSADFVGSSGGGNNSGTLFAANTAGTFTQATLSAAVAVSGPFRYNNDTYAWVGYAQVLGQRQTPLSGTQVYNPSPQSVALLYNFTKQRYVARLGYGTINYATYNPSPIVKVASGSFAFGMVRNVALTATAGTVYNASVTTAPVTAPYFATITFATTSQLQSARIGSQQFLANGLPYSYDGAAVTEHGFAVAPEILNIQEIGSNITAAVGARQYIAVWEWTDAQGQLHQSAPSGVFTYTRTTATTYAPVLTFSPLQFTQKTGVNIALYKTTNAGQIFFRLGTASATTIGSYINTTGATVAAFCFTDFNDADTDIGGSIAYTVGGELPNDAPPACSIVSAGRTRLFLAGGEDNNVITYSKEVVASLGLGFSLALTQRIDAVPGPVTGIVTLDDKIVAMKASNIFYWSGTGPTANGANNDFTDVQILTNGVGCVNAPSIVKTPDAALFQSSRGIYQLSRDLSVSFIGAPVSTLGQLNIASAVIAPAKGHVRFGSASADCLVYAYEALSQYTDLNVTAGQWSTFTNCWQVGATVWQGNYAFAKSNGQVCVETTGFSDNGSAITMNVQTGWIRPAGPLEAGAFYEVAVLGQWQGPHILRVEQLVDYSTAPVGSIDFACGAAVTGSLYGTGVWGSTTPWGGDSDIAYALRGVLPVSSPQIAAMQLKLKDLAMSGQILGDSVTLNSVTVLAATDDGALLRAAQKKFSGS